MKSSLLTILLILATFLIGSIALPSFKQGSPPIDYNILDHLNRQQRSISTFKNATDSVNHNDLSPSIHEISEDNHSKYETFDSAEQIINDEHKYDHKSQEEKEAEEEITKKILKILDGNISCKQFEKIHHPEILKKFNNQVLNYVKNYSDSELKEMQLLHLRSELIHYISRCRCIDSFDDKEFNYDRKLKHCIDNTKEQLDEFMETKVLNAELQKRNDHFVHAKNN